MTGYTNLKNDVHTTQEKITDIRYPIDGINREVHEISGYYEAEVNENTGAVFDASITYNEVEMTLYAIYSYEKQPSGSSDWNKVNVISIPKIPHTYLSEDQRASAMFLSNNTGIGIPSTMGNADKVRKYHYTIGFIRKII